jgi:anti-sigma regulatory factor (Ser/Thr protein kinase)
MSEIDFLGSSGLDLLIVHSKRVLSAGFHLVLVNPNEMVEMVLRVGRLDRVMPITRDLDGAVELATGVARSADLAASDATPARHASPAGSVETGSDGQEASDASLKLSVPNASSELSGLHDSVAEFLADRGVPRRAAFAVNLVIHELVANVIRYAYIDDDPHPIDIALVIEKEQINVWISDDGRPYDPRGGPSLDLHADEREVGELGLLLVLEFVNVLTYQRRDEKNHVELRIHLDREQEPSDLASAGGD